MADRFRRTLSGWRIAALLPAAALTLAALLAACASDPLAEEYEDFLWSARLGFDLNELKRDYGTNYEELLARARMDEDVSEEEYNELFREPSPKVASQRDFLASVAGDGQLSIEDYQYILSLARDLSNEEYEELLGLAQKDGYISDEEHNEFLEFSRQKIAPPPPLLLNDPPAPIHTGGAPYPHGTFPPELAPLWEETIGSLQQPVSRWGGGTVSEQEYAAFFAQNPNHHETPGSRICVPEVSQVPANYLLIENQLLFTYEEALDEPAAVIEAELRAAGVEFESVTVRTREYYDERYDPRTFINWLESSRTRYHEFEHLAAIENAGAELHPEARRFTPTSYPEPEPEHIYQAKLHGFDGDVRFLGVPNGRRLELGFGCGFGARGITQWLLGGLYTTFGDDVVLVINHSRITGPEPLTPPPILLNDPPPPIHTGGAPYPHGTFPPEAVPLWEDMIEYLQQPVSIWNGGAVGIQDYVAFFERNAGHPESHIRYNSCPSGIMPRGQWHVASQLLFNYEEELDDPLGSISAELRMAGVEHDSITVRTREYYDERYDPETFYNWLSPDNIPLRQRYWISPDSSRYNHFAALERLGAETHPEVRRFNPIQIYDMLDGYSSMAGTASAESSEAIYQVKLHGFDGDVRELEVTNGEAVQGSFRECVGRIKPAHEILLLMEYMVGGLYTTFGDDLVLHNLEPE